MRSSSAVKTSPLMSFPRASVSFDFACAELLRRHELAREDDLLVLVRDLDADGRAAGMRSMRIDSAFNPRQRSSTSPTIFE